MAFIMHLVFLKYNEDVIHQSLMILILMFPHGYLNQWTICEERPLWTVSSSIIGIMSDTHS